MRKVIAIVGPTASGKSDFAIRLAKEINAEIISGDSIQVYRGFNIGSGKVTKEEMAGIPHHLMDIKGPKDKYSVKEFQSLSRQILAETNKPMIFCGGTGLYLKAALYDYDFPEEEITHFDYSRYSNEELYQRLKEVDPKQAEKIHPNNRQRLERSLTIYEQSGVPQSTLVDQQEKKALYDVAWIGIEWDREVLYQRINLRVEKMIEAGLPEEVKSLLENGSTFEDQAMKGIGYREWKDYFFGEQSLEETKYLIQRNSRHFAKRQYTWFHHQVPVKWFSLADEEKLIMDIKAWLK
ncbi:MULTISPECIES: tRNA (adenosine(37)-N6)-dimethylallyltransferase MiaA [Terrabacteria group]|uniref:tRNA (adenosine(37)-N6)-dimethylallyltransferase MiaA n=1 Tax=Bacillati TaxID=1783272 RepID=UPI001C6EE2AF|nr:MULTISPECIES: tRNA (adenosine(37)-N6)-dimethylallyltransferase MiaA [Terrabacteria group]MBW9212561.1 tRNA (adenosine(37)-N6)-dimethylallyltransferase MiaA [Trueperella sp. zg.1013]